MAKEWREVRLSDVADVDRESLGSATDRSLEFDYISLANVEAGRIVGPLKRLRYSQAPTRARRVLRCGDILVSTVRPNLLGFARVDAGHQCCIASTGFAAISPGGDLHSEYLFQYMFSRHMRSQLQSLVVGSNYPAINSADLLKLADTPASSFPATDDCRDLANMGPSHREFASAERKRPTAEKWCDADSIVGCVAARSTSWYCAQYPSRGIMIRPDGTSETQSVTYFDRESGEWVDLRGSARAMNGEGVTPISSASEKLKAALLSSLQMQNVVVFAGSGTSLGVTGGPSMRDLWESCVMSSDDRTRVLSAAQSVIDTVGYDQLADDDNIETLLSRCDAYNDLFPADGGFGVHRQVKGYHSPRVFWFH